MKTSITPSSSKRTGERGAALIAVLVFAISAVLVMGVYLELVNSDAKNISRSQDWNRSLAYAEAGVDEALAQINASPSDFSANSWGGSGGNFGPVTRTLAGGSYSVSIVGGPVPTIYSTGFVNVASSDQQVSRVVKVSAKQLGLFPVAVAAINNITFNGGKPEWTINSYNSHDPNLSNNGLYDPSRTSTNGNVATVQGVFNPGNHWIAGSVYLGPTAVFSGGGVISGSVYTDYNVQFPDVVVPNPPGGWIAAIPQTTTIGFNKKGKPITSLAYHFTSSGNYKITGDYPIEIDAGVKATLNVTASTFDMTSLQIHDGGNIEDSGTAYVYLNGPSSVALSGNQATDASGRPENLWVYGTSQLTSITFSGNAQFTGVIYAPEANVSLNGGGNNSLDVAGSVVVNSFTLNGQFNVHYDEYLSSLGSRGFIPTSWQELAQAGH